MQSLCGPFAVYIKKDKHHYVEPDISVICDKNKLDEKGYQGAPDWMIEIVSLSSKQMDYERKVKIYREAGAREYWIVNAETETVTVYDFAHSAERQGSEATLLEPMRHSFSERIKVGIFEDLWLSLQGWMFPKSSKFAETVFTVKKRSPISRTSLLHFTAVTISAS